MPVSKGRTKGGVLSELFLIIVERSLFEKKNCTGLVYLEREWTVVTSVEKFFVSTKKGAPSMDID